MNERERREKEEGLLFSGLLEGGNRCSQGKVYGEGGRERER
jgi:hypothetical protein